MRIISVAWLLAFSVQLSAAPVKVENIRIWAAPDNTPPTVSATSPANAITGVTLNSTVSVGFSEPMNNSTLRKQSG